MRVDNLTPVLVAAPGEQTHCRIRIENTDPGPLTYRVRVIGFDDQLVQMGHGVGHLDAGAIEEIDLGFHIPEAFAAGHHSVGVEVTPDRPGTAPVIAGLTVTVGSIDEVALAVVPSTIRGRRRARFRLDIDNRADTPIDLELAGSGPDLAVRMHPDRVHLRPGDRVRTSGRVKGPRHLVGDTRHHTLTVTARGRSAPSYAPAAFQQRPLFPRPLRTAIVVLLAVALWASAMGGVLLWWSARDDVLESTFAARLVDTDGDGQPDTAADQLVDTDGDGNPDTRADQVAEDIANGVGPGSEPPPEDDGEELPTETIVGGTVKAGETGDDEGVAVALTPLDLGETPSPEALMSEADAERPTFKLWPSRFGTYRPAGRSPTLQTVSVESTASGPDGAFLITNVPIRQTYELHLSKPGFDSQSFVVVPTEDGEPMEYDVVLEPANGRVSGSVGGPAGPLGNVDIVVTDGTLTFTTTSSSDAGNRGAWSLSGISTPGTYTLTATLGNHGTEVLQIPLEPGEQRNDIVISMTPDVGSIIGRVTAGGEAFGGVTLTASNADDTRTTTSLTEGDTGLFNFPKLPTPGRYTVTASADGYVTQTRLVTLGGNVTGIDFDLVATTGAIVGLVVSTKFGPLPGANINVTRDELSFSSSSAAAPDAGSFNIPDLPPGTYRVEFSRFDHLARSQVVSVEAGERLDLDRIRLEFTDRPVLPQTGRVRIRVTDSIGDALNGALVRLIDVSTDEEYKRQRDRDDAQSTFVFENVPIGTYIVEVSKRRFRTADRRISVGLDLTEETVALFLLGQASGRLVDSLKEEGEEGFELDDYEVNIVRINNDGTETPVERIPVPPGAPPDGGPDRNQIRWETQPNSLTSGRYRVDVTDPPPGYRVVPDAILDDPRPGEEPLAPMEFVVSPTEEDPLDLNDIEADRFPVLSGVVLSPELDPVDNTVSFVPLDSPTLAVTLTCVGAPRTVPAPELSPDDLGPGGYRFDFVTLEANAMRGDCTLTVSADGFTTADMPLPTPLEPTDGTSSPDKVVNVALVEPSSVAGTAYWKDAGNGDNELPAAGIEIETRGRVIIGFDPQEDGDPEPQIARNPLLAITDAEGVWAFGEPRQVFGRTTYVFSNPAYVSRLISVTLNEDGRIVAVADSSTKDLADVPGTGIAVEMDANGGHIDGIIEVQTIKGTDLFPGSTPNFDGFEVVVSGAANASATPVRIPGTTTGVARIDTPDPGTYEAAVSRPVHHRPFDGLPQTGIPLFQNPGDDTGFEREYVELAEITVVVRDSDEDPIPGAVITLTHDSTGDPGDPADEEREEPGGATASVTFHDLPVNSLDPVGTSVTYGVTTTAPGFDLQSGQFTIEREDGTSETCAIATCGLPVITGLRAGGVQTVRFQPVPEFGSIAGNVIAELAGPGSCGIPPDPDGAGPQNCEALTLAAGSELTVTAQRVAGPDGSILPQPDDELSAVIDPEDPEGFKVSGLPGYYTITPLHPDFQLRLVPGPQPGQDPVEVNGQPVWQLTNEVRNDIGDPWIMEVERGRVRVRALVDSLGGGGIDQATVTISLNRPTGPNPGVVDEVLTDGNGDATIDDLLPRTYWLTVRKKVPVDPLDPTGDQQDQYFPVIVNITVPRGDEIEDRTVTVRAPLPQIGGAIEGNVLAWNSSNRPVTLPDEVTVDRDYTLPQVDVDGSGVDNDANNDDLDLPPGVEPPRNSLVVEQAADGSSGSYRFETMPTGVHDLVFTVTSATPQPWYTAPPDITAEVIDVATTPVEDAIFRVPDRRLVIQVRHEGRLIDGLSVRLTHPDAAVADIPLTRTALGTYTAAAVPPEVDPYTAVIEEPNLTGPDPFRLFREEAREILVPPGPAGTTLEEDVDLVGVGARIEGTASKQQTATSTVPLVNEGTVSLLNAAGTVVDSVTPGGAGEYLFELRSADNAPGNYRVRVELDDHAPRTSAPFAVGFGREIDGPDVVVPAFARFAITVNGPAPADVTVVVSQPPSQTGLAPSIDGNVWTFVVDPRLSSESAQLWRFTVSSPQYVTQIVPDPARDPAPGETIPIPVTLAARTVSGRITSPGGDGNITVEATKGAATRSDTTASNGDYTMSGFDPGDWLIVSEVLGEGRQTRDLSIAVGAGNQTGIDLTLDPRDVAVTFNVAGGGNTAAVQLFDDDDVVASGTTAAGAVTLTVADSERTFPLDWRVTQPGKIPRTGSVDIDALTDTFDLETLSVTQPVPALDSPAITGTVRRPDTTTGATNTTVFMCLGATGVCGAATANVITDRTSGTGGFSVVPAGQGTYRLSALRDNGELTTTLVTVAVSAEGVLTPATPLILQLSDPP